MKVEPRVTTIADAGVSGWIAAHSARGAQVFRVRRRKVSGCFAASSGNVCSSRTAAILQVRKAERCA
jgi:hypothetical protein